MPITRSAQLEMEYDDVIAPTERSAQPVGSEAGHPCGQKSANLPPEYEVVNLPVGPAAPGRKSPRGQGSTNPPPEYEVVNLPVEPAAPGEGSPQGQGSANPPQEYEVVKLQSPDKTPQLPVKPEHEIAV